MGHDGVFKKILTSTISLMNIFWDTLYSNFNLIIFPIQRHCLRPDFNVWRLVSKLQDPHQFANWLKSREHLKQNEPEMGTGHHSDKNKILFHQNGSHKDLGHRQVMRNFHFISMALLIIPD